MISVETKRAFTSKGMMMALLIGIAIALGHFLTNALPYGTSEGFEGWRTGVFNTYPPSVFSSWLGGTTGAMFSGIYYFTLPLVACLPYAATFFTDCQSGYVENVLCRASMKKYLASKMLAVALTSGTVVVVPLAVNLVLTTLVLPILVPESAARLFSVPASALCSDLYYTAPFAYVGCFAILAFITGALVGLTGFALTFAMPNRVMVLIAPFLCSIILYFAENRNPDVGAYNPISLSDPLQHYVLTAEGLTVMLAVWVVLIALGMCLTSRHTKGLLR